MQFCSTHTSVVSGPSNIKGIGNSVLINLLSDTVKVCNYNCIYCEKGWTDLKKIHRATFPDRFRILKQLTATLVELRIADELPESITISGNGESTLHPDFPAIVDDIIWLRNKYAPGAVVSVYTNGTLLNRKEIVKALMKADRRIIKLDAGSEEEFHQIDQPIINRSFSWLKEHIKYFNSKVIIQSLFLRGYYSGQLIDNTKESSIVQWLEAIDEIKPEQVLICSAHRPTAAATIQQVDSDVLREIAERVEELGIKAIVC